MVKHYMLFNLCLHSLCCSLTHLLVPTLLSTEPVVVVNCLLEWSMRLPSGHLLLLSVHVEVSRLDAVQCHYHCHCSHEICFSLMGQLPQMVLTGLHVR